jgi:uncharacterized protein involved in outer membrane biogenesis
MRRIALIVLACAAGITALILVAAAIAVKTVDLRTLIAPVQARVKAEIGRDLAVAGPIDLEWSLVPKIVVSDVTLSNAPWSKTPEMIRAKRVEARVALLPLLSRRFEVVELTLSDPVIMLETDGKGHTNWDFGATPAMPASVPAATASVAASANAFGIANLAIDRGIVTYLDGATGKATRVAIERLQVRARSGNAPVEAEFRGTVDDVALAFTGNLGPLDALRAGQSPYPVTVKGDVAGKPAAVSAKLAMAGGTITLDELDVTFGTFAAKGHVSVSSTGNRRKYSFKLTTPVVMLGDLPVLAAAGAAPAPVAAKHTAQFIFEDRPLSFESIGAFDADGELTMAGVALDKGLKLSDVQIALTLQDGKLDITRMQSSAFGGTLRGRVSLDAAHPGSPKVAVKLDGQNLDLAAILAATGRPRPVRGGKTTLDMDIVARGVSPHAWASSATGTVTVVVGPATLVNTKLNLDNALDNLVQAVNPFRARDPSTELQCAVVRLPLADGIARIDRSIAAETAQIAVAASGTLNFRTETLDLALRPRVKQGIPIDIPQMAQLVRFAGPFTHPGVSIDAVGTATTLAKIGAAIGTGGLSVLGTSLFELTQSGNVCDAALGRAAPAHRAETAAKSPAADSSKLGKALGKLFGTGR